MSDSEDEPMADRGQGEVGGQPARKIFAEQIDLGIRVL